MKKEKFQLGGIRLTKKEGRKPLHLERKEKRDGGPSD